MVDLTPYGVEIPLVMGKPFWLNVMPSFGEMPRPESISPNFILIRHFVASEIYIYAYKQSKWKSNYNKQQ